MMEYEKELVQSMSLVELQNENIAVSDALLAMSHDRVPSPWCFKNPYIYELISDVQHHMMVSDKSVESHKARSAAQNELRAYIFEYSDLLLEQISILESAGGSSA